MLIFLLDLVPVGLCRTAFYLITFSFFLLLPNAAISLVHRRDLIKKKSKKVNAPYSLPGSE